MAQREDPLLDTQVSEYVIQERIGAGGMGIVYRAIQPLIGKQVAIKVLKAEFAEARELVQRLLVEARVVNAIQHRGIIDIFGFGQLTDGRPYMVMELLQGVSLERFIRSKGRVGFEEALRILDEMLDALGAAHAQGVVHRDLKPGNVFLVDGAGGGRSIKLLDFGIAKVAASQMTGPLTVEGLILGTPEYMSPEQVRGGEVGPASDLYAVGVIAFQLLTGKVPFGGEQLKVLFAQVEEAPPALSMLAPGMPLELERLVSRLLAKAPSQRFQAAEAVRQEFKAVLSRKASSWQDGGDRPTEPLAPLTGVRRGRATAVAVPALPPKPRPQPPSRKPARGRWLMGAGAVALAASVVGVKLMVGEPRAAALESEARPPEARAPEPSLPAPPLPRQPEGRAEKAVAAEHPVGQEVPIVEMAPKLMAAPNPVASQGRRQERLTAPGEPPRPLAAALPMAQAAAASRPKGPAAPAVKAEGPLVQPVAEVPRVPAPVQPSAAEVRCSREEMQQRLAEATVRLRQRSADALTSPAMARLMEIHRRADGVSTDEQCASTMKLLVEWERKVFSKR
ncbi:protein kinase domain-containing protein [Stigmatella hybrida]|uniref:protein kinase domain-containing protein n=1 Tax=Stigmatella hybrida TaxID=394097 RepID=UPI001CDAB20C|nr:serine/threonine-protein kinase [Stigmatella hybrida]